MMGGTYIGQVNVTANRLSSITGPSDYNGFPLTWIVTFVRILSVGQVADED
jgi:hypothetical protein